MLLWKIQVQSIYILISATFTHAQTLQDMKSLHDALFTNYRTDIVPTNNHSAPFEIGISSFLLAINEFRELEETLVMNGALFLNWTDVSLTWDSSSYSNKTFITVDSSRIWTPKFYLINNADKLEPIGSDTFFEATVSNDGAVFYAPGGILEAKCAPNTAKFPLDDQTCELEFLIWGAGFSMYSFKGTATTINQDYYTPNSNWEITKTSSAPLSIQPGYHTYKASVTLKRKPAYYIVMIILPTILLCLLNPLVFLLPFDSGERISLAVTILLSYAIFLTLVAQSVPASSNPMCFLLIVMIIIMMISGITVVAVIISGYYYYYGKKYTPGKFALFLMKLNKSKVDSFEGMDKQPFEHSAHDMSASLDKLFFVVSYIIIIIVIVVYFCYVVF